MDRETVNKLAKLARIEIGGEEAEKLSSELGNILGYVSDLKVAMTKNQETRNKPASLPNRNVMREDVEPHESGIYTEELLGAVPNLEENYVRVKKIL